MNKISFLIYLDYEEQFNLLTDEQLGQLMRAIMQYEKTGEIIELDGITKMAFSFIKVQLDRDREKYNEICQRNKENGAKGGRPKKEKLKKRMVSKKTEWFSEKPKKPEEEDEEEKEDEIDNEDDTNILREKNVKKDKKIHFAEYVTMTNANYENLVSTYGKEFADQCIEKLDNYKGSSGKKYKDDYRAIKSWVIGEIEKENKAKPKNKSNCEQRKYNTADFDNLYANSQGG